jgi:hypothetical protein
LVGLVATTVGIAVGARVPGRQEARR